MVLLIEIPFIYKFAGGKPITPTGDSQTFASGGVQLNGHTTDNGTSVVDGAIKAEVCEANSKHQMPHIINDNQQINSFLITDIAIAIIPKRYKITANRKEKWWCSATKHPNLKSSSARATIRKSRCDRGQEKEKMYLLCNSIG